MEERSVCFANIKFSGVTRDQVFSQDRKLKIIATVNTEFIYKAERNNRFLNVLNQCCTTFDGYWPYLMAKVKNRKNIEQISGSDLIYEFSSFAKNTNKRMFLLGGYEESNSVAVKRLKEIYDIQVSGFSPEHKPYPFDYDHNEKIKAELKKFMPDILFVGFGSVKQELWLYDNKEFLNNIGVKWAVGCGGTFEFVSGKIKRAPKIMQMLCMEGLWRLISEPNIYRLKRLLLSVYITKYLFLKERIK